MELLCRLERWRGPGDPLVLHVPLGDDRAAALAEVWQRGWPDRYPLVLDAQRPGAPFEVGDIAVETWAVRVGDPRWATGEVEPGVGMALRIAAGGLVVAVALGAGPERAVQRACDGADLAVVEVGVAPWPRTDAPWRIRVDQAPLLAAGARQLWLVGDDGAPVAEGAA
ncbi:MAG: hypothetical protein R3F59_08835 [Myxococcota bacterium]